jgi:hypothetical protein
MVSERLLTAPRLCGPLFSNITRAAQEHLPAPLTGAGSLTVTITNTLAASTIISAGQAVSDLSFTLSNAPGILGNTTSSTPMLTLGNPCDGRGEGAPPPGGQGLFSIVGRLRHQK